MEKAIIFQNGESVLVTADEVLSGKYSGDSEFVDAEYPEYKVCYVCAGKPMTGQEIGRPYFRLYYSYEDYKRLFPDRADRYAIVADMRRFQETQWHRGWKEILSSFCEIEKCFKNPVGKWKFADAYNFETNTCIELQHSYTSFEFEERNLFYTQMGITMIWLFHLPKAQVKQAKDGYYEVLEDNSRGFFRAAYESNCSFSNANIYIQTKDGLIYKISKLQRRQGYLDGIQATTFFFEYEGSWDEAQWVDMLKSGQWINAIKKEVCNDAGVPNDNIESVKDIDNNEHALTNTIYSLDKLWGSDFKWIQVFNYQTNETIFLIHNNRGEPQRDPTTTCLRYKYSFGNNSKFYYLPKKNEYLPVWKPIKARLLSGAYKTFDQIQECI